MIKQLRIKDPKNSCTEWWGQVKPLKGKKAIPFKPGLNILWGPNGSGKSTILTTLARMLHAEQGGQTIVTQHSVREVVDAGFGMAEDTYKDGVLPTHDGQAIFHFNPSHAVGLLGGGFDDDFFREGIMNTMARGSSGETTLQRIVGPLRVLGGEESWPEIEWKIRREHVNDVWGRWLRHVEKTLKGTMKSKGQPTMLLDEPDRSLDLHVQQRFWERLPKIIKSDGVQVIAATHSVFAADIPGANYIEMVPGYLDKCREAIDKAFGQEKDSKP